MILKVGDKEASDYEVLDLDTGEFIRGVQWVDDEKGQLERMLFDKNGNIIYTDDETQTVIEHRNIKLVRK